MLTEIFVIKTRLRIYHLYHHVELFATNHDCGDVSVGRVGTQKVQ